MRRPFYLKLRGNFWYFRLNKESGCVESDEQRWRATGCTDREAAEQYIVNFISDSPRSVIPTHLKTFRQYSMPFFVWDECPHISDRKSDFGPSVNAGLPGHENVVGQPIPRLRHMVISIVLSPALMNNHIFEELVR